MSNACLSPVHLSFPSLKQRTARSSHLVTDTGKTGKPGNDSSFHGIPAPVVKFFLIIIFISPFFFFCHAGLLPLYSSSFLLLVCIFFFGVCVLCLVPAFSAFFFCLCLCLVSRSSVDFFVLFYFSFYIPI